MKNSRTNTVVPEIVPWQSAAMEGTGAGGMPHAPCGRDGVAQQPKEREKTGSGNPINPQQIQMAAKEKFKFRKGLARMEVTRATMEKGKGMLAQNVRQKNASEDRLTRSSRRERRAIAGRLQAAPKVEDCPGE